MDCKNKHCLRYFDGMCCPENEEDFGNATGEIDCPSSLRGDFYEAIKLLQAELITRVVNDLSFVDLIKVREFILNLKNKKMEE